MGELVTASCDVQQQCGGVITITGRDRGSGGGPALLNSDAIGQQLGTPYLLQWWSELRTTKYMI